MTVHKKPGGFVSILIRFNKAILLNSLYAKVGSVCDGAYYPVPDSWHSARYLSTRPTEY
jgi:hypothetical protein